MLKSSSIRITLRRLEPFDRADIVEMHEAGRHVERWSPPLRMGLTYDQMFDQWLADDPARHVRLVTERLDRSDGPRLTNVIGISEIVRGVFNSGFIGWRTHPALLHQGYGTEALSHALDYAFGESGLALHRVQAAILADNLASRRVAEKNGFRLEGVAERYLYIREQWRDHMILAITREEWPPASRHQSACSI